MLSSAELSSLWQKHAAALLLIARGHCGNVADGAAEDCVQEAFIRLARQNPAPDCASAWLMKTVRHAAIDAVRSQQRRSNRERSVARAQPQWLEQAESSRSEQLSPEEVQHALQKLDNQTRDILVAHLWNSMTFRQIADTLEISAATAHRRYEDGIEQLRNLTRASPLPQCELTLENAASLAQKT